MNWGWTKLLANVTIVGITMVGLYPLSVRNEFQVKPFCELSSITLAMMWYPMDIIIK